MSAPGSLIERVVAFCRALRSRGLLATPAHAAEAVRALLAVGPGDRQQAWLALRCVLATRPEDFPIFDELFAQMFALPEEERAQVRAPHGPERREEKPPGEQPVLTLSRWLAQGEAQPEEDDEPEEMAGASELPALVEKDFSSFDADELEEIERLAARLARRLAARPSRRWKPARRGPRIDLRRTARRSLARGGETISLALRQRKPRKTRIVALCDVSGSMDLYSRFLLQFLYALQGTWARVESFVFSTDLRRVTEALRERPYASALAGLRETVRGWSGGTRIGACLSTFNSEWGRLVDRRTVVLVLSDGWDTGEPAQLAEALESLRMRSRRLIWLNPLLGSPGYEPLTQGMQAALPHVSVFAPAHNLASLRALERHLLH